MNRTLIVLVPLCCLLAACNSTPPNASFVLNCRSEPTDVCPPGLDKRNKIKIHVTPAGVMATPPVVCATKGTTVTATVTKAESVPDGVLVATVPKDGEDGWVLGADNAPGQILIEVPATTDLDDYGYFVLASTGKCLDPIIRVDR